MAQVIIIGGGSGGGSGSPTPHNSLPGKQGTGPEYYHLTEAEYLALVGAASPNNKFGEISLAPGSTAVSVTFASPFIGAADYIVQLSFRNETDPTPNVLVALVTARTLTDFTCRLAGEVDTSNYVMMWRAFR